jgi:hypothetical protein
VLAIQKRAYEAGWEDGYFRTPHRTQWIEIGTVSDYDDGYDDGASACPSHSHLARLHTDHSDRRKSACHIEPLIKMTGPVDLAFSF